METMTYVKYILRFMLIIWTTGCFSYQKNVKNICCNKCGPLCEEVVVKIAVKIYTSRDHRITFNDEKSGC
jgi:hypothetical protein